jgi:acetylornithine deacetylase/succinyl-diaminopimelate desuccinylase-like protein
MYSLFTNTVTLTSVQSGFGVVNQVPNHITATLDCRLLPEYPSEKTLEFIRKALDNDKIEIKVLKSTEPVVISGVENVHYQNLKASIEDIYADAKVIPLILPVFNETGKFQAKGVQAFSITPLQLETEHLHCIHAENERIPIQVLQKGSQVYLKFLEYATVQGITTE